MSKWLKLVNLSRSFWPLGFLNNAYVCNTLCRSVGIAWDRENSMRKQNNINVQRKINNKKK